MAPLAAKIPTQPLVLVHGEDDFAVKQRAREIFERWREEIGGMDHETVDGSAANSGEALAALAKLRGALQTLPFFGTGKAIWLKNCSFFGDDRTASSQAVGGSVTDLAQELKAFRWDNVKLLISAGKVDKRKVIYKTIEKLGAVEFHPGLSMEDRDWAQRAESFARQECRDRKKDIAGEALAELVISVGPNLRELSQEVEKLSLYVGDRPSISLADVSAIVTKHKQARAFALGDALGDRDLPRLLRRLDEELWEVRGDSSRSAIGLLYGIINKVRVLLLVKELVHAGLLRPENDYSRFKGQIEQLPAEALPEDKKYNPMAMSPYVLFRALPQIRRWSSEDLVRAMDLLLRCNQRLVSSSLDEALVLQQTLVQIVGGKA